MSRYRYYDAKPTYANSYLWPVLTELIASKSWPKKRAFDLGCGNGATCNLLSQQGFEVSALTLQRAGCC